MYLNFSDIPGHENLFLDYLYEFDNVKQFYKHNFRDENNYKAHFTKVSSIQRSFKNELCEIILKQYGTKKLSAKTAENIALLKKNNTVAILTGQQIGIIGGPLYTFYKLITTVKLAESLSLKYKEFNFVPVFWLASDDHDFEEINNINIIDRNNQLKNLPYDELPAEFDEDSTSKSVGKIALDQKIDVFFENLKLSLRETEFTSSILGMLSSFYTEGSTFSDAFYSLLYSLFDMYGIVLFNPQDKGVKRLLRPIFHRELENYRVHTEKLIAVSAKLEEIYHAQVKVRPLNLFISTDAGRFSIEPTEDNMFRLKRKKGKFSKQELFEIIEAFPEQISPNVLLRPICQDYLFPTAFYVGGPAELAYFAQLLPLYDFFGIPEPMAYPRSSLTLIEKNTATTLQKYKVSPIDLMNKSDIVKTKLVKFLTELNIDDSYDNFSKAYQALNSKLKTYTLEIDSSLGDPADKFNSKILSNLEELKSKSVSSLKKRHEITLQQIEKAIAAVYPDNSLQERTLNFFYFANKYGLDILDKIWDELKIHKFEHQILNL